MAEGDVAVDVTKREVRQRMREQRRALVERSDPDALAQRSARIVERLVALDVVAGAARVLAYRSLPGEVDTATLIDWCRVRGAEVALPDATPDAVLSQPAAWPDVIVVPSLAVTMTGKRLGQGGGWYDRVLAERRADAVAVGLAFADTVVDDLPTEPHDVQLDCIVTEGGAVWAA